jgi:hypothetical protein
MGMGMTFTGTVLALDLATVTGYAWGKPGTKPRFGHTRFAVKSGASRAQTYRHFRCWMQVFAESEYPDLIVYESPAVPSIMAGKTNINTIKLLMGLAEHLEEWAYGSEIELREASVSQVRAHFIGQNLKSKIAKPMVLEACRARGWMCQTTDESDACALWDYQCCWLAPEIAHRNMPLFRKRVQ